MIGNYALVKVDNTLISGQVTSSIGITLDLVDVVIEGGVYRERIPDRVSASISMSAQYSDTDYATLFNAMVGRQLVGIKYGGINTGDKYIEANGYITSLNRDDAKNELSTINIEITVTGEFLIKTV